jgi:hypothetical protein
VSQKVIQILSEEMDGYIVQYGYSYRHCTTLIREGVEGITGTVRRGEYFNLYQCSEIGEEEREPTTNKREEVELEYVASQECGRLEISRRCHLHRSPSLITYGILGQRSYRYIAEDGLDCISLR